MWWDKTKNKTIATKCHKIIDGAVLDYDFRPRVAIRRGDS